MIALVANESTREEILQCVEQIPAGRVMSYGDIAEFIGSRAPRQVGRVLAENGGGIPWHRVVHSDGSCTAALYEQQRQLLNQEGITFVGNRVDMQRHRWDGS